MTFLSPEQQRADVEAIRAVTSGPIGLNHLLAFAEEERFGETLRLRPRVVSTAWAWPEQDLCAYVSRAHDAGALLMHMVSGLPEAVRAARAGAGLAAALALGAEGVLLGTRFLATPEAPIHESDKRAILNSDGHDTLLTEIADIAQRRVWPGAMSRVRRNVS